MNAEVAVRNTVDNAVNARFKPTDRASRHGLAANFVGDGQMASKNVVVLGVFFNKTQQRITFLLASFGSGDKEIRAMRRRPVASADEEVSADARYRRLTYRMTKRDISLTKCCRRPRTT